jgi:hypothetical protein
MKRKMAIKRILSLVYLSFSIVAGLIAQNSSLSVKIDRDTLGLDDVVKIEFILENLKGEFIPPDFSGFRVVSGPNFYSSYSMINGRGRDYKSYQYLLSPLDAGMLEIGPATVSGGEKEFLTPKVSVFVENISSSRKGNIHEFKSPQHMDPGSDDKSTEKKRASRRPLRRI